MIDGTYQIEVETPFGRKPGTLSIRTEGDRAFANIDAPMVGKQQVEGHIEGDSFTAEGSFKLKLIGQVSYELHGEVDGDDLHIAIDSSKGTIELAGKRV